MRVSGCPIAADAHADRPRTAPLPLRIPDGVKDGLPDTVEVSIRPSEVGQFDRQRVLCVDVLASAALENELDLDFVLLPLLEMHDRHPGPEVVARVLARDRIDRVRA